MEKRADLKRGKAPYPKNRTTEMCKPKYHY